MRVRELARKSEDLHATNAEEMPHRRRRNSSARFRTSDAAQGASQAARHGCRSARRVPGAPTRFAGRAGGRSLRAADPAPPGRPLHLRREIAALRPAAAPAWTVPRRPLWALGSPSSPALRLRLRNDGACWVVSFRPRNQQAGLQAEKDLNKISRRPGGRFNVIQCSPVRPLEDTPTESCEQQTQSRREVVTRYIIPSDPGVVLTLRQRKDSGIDLSDFISSQKHDIDSTGLVCMWPAEEIMTYYCISRRELFRNKRVIELGSGYGLAGLAIAACTEASEVLLTDGNPQVVEYIRKNITENSGQFGHTKVRTCALHWSRHQAAMPGLNFDVVIAADCTFFKDFHVDLAHTIKGLLSTSDGCPAILFNPRRGDSLDRFVRACQSVQLDVDIQEQYDSRIWELHQGFSRNEARTEWPNYDEDHCYPLFLSITHEQPSIAEAL